MTGAIQDNPGVLAPPPLMYAGALALGPLRLTRNPFYLSLTLLYTGMALMVNSLWTILLLPGALIVIRYGVINREERFLEQKFGEQYLGYKAKVRRWM